VDTRFSHNIDTDTHNNVRSVRYCLVLGRGKVVKLIAGGSFIELDHGNIPGYMSAMSMLFAVAYRSTVRGIAMDDSARFQISDRGEILKIN